MSAAEVKSGTAATPEWLELVKKQVGSLHYGVVQIIIHDSHVTQVEKTERVRLTAKHTH